MCLLVKSQLPEWQTHVTQDRHKGQTSSSTKVVHAVGSTTPHRYVRPLVMVSHELSTPRSYSYLATSLFAEGQLVALFRTDINDDHLTAGAYESLHEEIIDCGIANESTDNQVTVVHDNFIPVQTTAVPGAKDYWVCVRDGIISGIYLSKSHSY